MRTSVGMRTIGAAMSGILLLAGCTSHPAEKADDTAVVEDATSEEEGPETDRSGLEDAISDAESVTLGGLSADVYSALSDAYDKAISVLENEDADQYEIDSAERSLISALDSAKRESESHTDEFTVVDAYAEPVNSYGFFDMVIVVQNNTDSAKEFQGVDIAELDANGNIVNSYMSYNKNAVDTVVEPGQQLSLHLTCAAEDGIAGVRITRYEYGPSIGQTGGALSETFTKMF